MLDRTDPLGLNVLHKTVYSLFQPAGVLWTLRQMALQPLLYEDAFAEEAWNCRDHSLGPKFTFWISVPFRAVQIRRWKAAAVTFRLALPAQVNSEELLRRPPAPTPSPYSPSWWRRHSVASSRPQLNWRRNCLFPQRPEHWATLRREHWRRSVVGIIGRKGQIDRTQEMICWDCPLPALHIFVIC